jgi:hypothetical protein
MATAPKVNFAGKSRLSSLKNLDPMNPRRALTLLALAATGSVFSGCASANLVRVKPWERATLTTYAMRPDRDPLHTLMNEHVFFSRETASGGRGVGGSGCGCN